jgi:UDP-N-acetylmuramyl-tripeptide synthetase 2
LNDNVAPTVAVSTADLRIGSKRITNTKKMTSLDVFDLQSLLSTAKNNGCKVAVLEASSQGLDQQRFAGIDFDMAVLTNITHDHLDYHGSMEAYAESKKLLFKNVLSNTKQNKF